MNSFDATEYGAFGQSPIAKAIWAFLNETEQRLRLVVASELGHAAIDGVALGLEKKFGASIRDHRTKQMTGTMIKHVLAPIGWRVEKKGIRVRVGKTFSVAAKYARN